MMNIDIPFSILESQNHSDIVFPRYVKVAVFVVDLIVPSPILITSSPPNLISLANKK